MYDAQDIMHSVTSSPVSQAAVRHDDVTLCMMM